MIHAELIARLSAQPYIVMFAAVPWAIWSFGTELAEDLSWWQLLPLLAVLSPFLNIGRLRWCDGANANGDERLFEDVSAVGCGHCRPRICSRPAR